MHFFWTRLRSAQDNGTFHDDLVIIYKCLRAKHNLLLTTIYIRMKMFVRSNILRGLTWHSHIFLRKARATFPSAGALGRLGLAIGEPHGGGAPGPRGAGGSRVA